MKFQGGFCKNFSLIKFWKKFLTFYFTYISCKIIHPYRDAYWKKLEDHHYVVTWDVDGNNHRDTYSKEEFRKYLFHEEFVPCVTMEKEENSIELE